MTNAQILVENISEAKMMVVKSSLFKDIETISNYLIQFNEEEMLNKYLKITQDFNDELYANIRELHENLEIFFSNNDELKQARKEANKEFEQHMNIIYNSKLISEMFDREREKQKKLQEEKDKFLVVGNETCEVVKKIDVLWCGWESDQYAYAVKTTNGIKLVTSNLGKLKFSKISELQDKIKEYKKAIDDSEELIKLLN